jgi:geranylgeranyl pyrophosphate synthase
VLYALGRPGCAARLRELAAADSGGPGYGELLREMRELVRQSGGIEFCRKQIENHAAQARRQLQALPAQEARQGLGMLLGRLLDNEGQHQPYLSQSV